MATRTRVSHSSKKPPRDDARDVTVVAGRHDAADVSVRELRELFRLPRKTFARMLGFSERAVADWESSRPLSDPARQRVREMARLQHALANVMRPDDVAAWLSAPNAAFQGLKPIEAIERGEVDRIWRMIYLLESGDPT